MRERSPRKPSTSHTAGLPNMLRKEAEHMLSRGWTGQKSIALTCVTHSSLSAQLTVTKTDALTAAAPLIWREKSPAAKNWLT